MGFDPPPHTEDTLASKEGTTTDRGSGELPFGAIPGDDKGAAGDKPKRKRKRSPRSKSKGQEGSKEEGSSQSGSEKSKRDPASGQDGVDGGPPRRRRRRRRGRGGKQTGAREGAEAGAESEAESEGESQPDAKGGKPSGARLRQRGAGRQRGKGAQGERFDTRVETGQFMNEKGDYGALRREVSGWRQSKEDIFVPKHLVSKYRIPEGAMVSGPIARGQKHKYQLMDVQTIDGKDPKEWKNQTRFQALTSIDPDFHYAVGDVTDNVSMRIVDLLCPIGRGQRGLIVAPPRTGKTTLMREFAAGIERGYPDVHLMIVLVDERPEEATEWRRSVERASVYVSTSDETSKIHIQTAEAAWKRACRLVENGEDVIMLLDSITRLARAYNNQAGSGRTMSGGLDSRAMERPRKLFGSARNTVEAGSLTILGTTLVQTGSRMDQMVFEEFKGTGNMEMVLNRKLADRRIFPAIDVEKAGTRKEEKLFGLRRLKLVHTLRRVLLRMNFIEAMELLITRLSEVAATDEFLKRFEVDPEA